MRFPKLFQRISLVAVILASACQAVLADDEFKDDWIVKVSAEKLERQFNYKGTSLNKVAKMTVEYYVDADPDSKTPYELMWFNDGKPIGLERQNQFKVPQGKTTAIQIVNKKATSPEVEKAAANIILRLSLDAYMNHNPVVSIKVPSQSLNGIVQEMEQLKCVETRNQADEDTKAKMVFALETENTGEGKILYYY